jgi:hypothetical protein
MRELLLYVSAGIVYTTLGVLDQNVLYSVFVGAAFLVVWVVVLPALVRRLRG